MNKIMIVLVGEQPVPNLLGIRDQNPEIVILLYTDLTEKSGVWQRLQAVVSKERNVVPQKVEPYNIASIETTVHTLLTNNQWQPHNVVFNLTGGTKTMALAGYNLAREWQRPFVYLQSEGEKTRRYFYEWRDDRHHLTDDIIREKLLDIQDYLDLHLGETYTVRGFREPFEQAVHDALAASGLEVRPGIDVAGKLEIDLIVRHTNQFGVIEVKTGRAGHGSDGVKQLNTAARREFFGIYTKKILVTQIEPHPNTRDLAEAGGVLILPLLESTAQSISEHDRNLLITGVSTKLGAR